MQIEPNRVHPQGCVSPNEAAKKLNITGEAIKQWIYRDRLPAAKANNGYWWIREKDLQEFIEKSKQGKDLIFKLHKSH